jgi:Family of unknown function (DUF5906)
MTFARERESGQAARPEPDREQQAIHSIDDHLAHVTVFPNEKSYKLTRHDMPLPKLRKMILDTAAAAKRELPWLKLAKFGDKRTEKNSLRHNANVLKISGVELDYDGKVMPLEEAIKILTAAKIRSLIYTIASHTEAEPKWRLLCPSSREREPDERDKLVARINGLFGGIFARESFVLSQGFLYGSVNNNQTHRVAIVDGDFIDLRDDLDAGAKGKHQEIAKANSPDERKNSEQDLNAKALQNLSAWVAKLFPDARGSGGGFRVSSKALARDLEEDLSITPQGIKDFGVHDMGDPREGKRSPIDLVMEHGGKDFLAAVAWLREQLGMSDEGVSLDDFYAYMVMHNYIFAPSREPWPASSVNARLGPVPLHYPDGTPVLDKKGKQKRVAANTWLDQNRPVEQITWAPGLPMLIQDRLVAEGGWIERTGVACFNLNRPPTIELGNAAEAERWLDHIYKVFGEDDTKHIAKYPAHRRQHPEEKINHALVLGGNQGIGKDTLIEPAKRAVGPWNFSEVSPQHLLGRFNGFLKSVILRVNEARDLGDVNRFQFYDHMKAYTAAPPDVLRVDEKNLREHNILNCCGVIITTNHKSNGIYLPADDRRHYVAWSELTKEDFTKDYWNSLWGWYASGGFRHVAAYLAELDLSGFDPKAPPPKTAAFWAIVDANRAPEDAELADALDQLANPDATTIVEIKGKASGGFYEWIVERKNRRVMPHRFESCGYVPVRNDAARDGLWKIKGERQVVYARADLSISDRLAAAKRLTQ